ncbi:MAG: YitT family protein [Ruminococcaceae bacterium]|nr:YitT family protein [Oscillospiraceae bacterium]
MKGLEWKKVIKEFLIITFGALLASAAIYFFMLPLNLAIGSGSAIAMMLSTFIPLPISVLSLILNVFLLILGILLVGREFGVKTIYASILVPTFLGMFELLFPNFKSLTNDPLIDVICYIIVVGMGMALLFSCNASSGGLDIVAKIMSKYLHMDIGVAVSLSGVVVAASSIFFYDTKIAVISVLGTYFGGMVVDKFIFGLNIKRRVCIISPELERIVDFILNDLHSGATLNEIIGAYDRTPRREVIVIVDKQEFRKLMDFVKKIDPKAFITVYAVSDMRYQPKNKNKPQR